MGYWKLDESSGNIVNDASSNNNTGTANSSSAIVTGIYGNARKVVQLGYTTSISIPNSTSLNLSGVKPFTIECLVKVSAHAYYGDIFIEKKGSYGLATGSYGSSGYLQLFIWPNITNPYVLQSNEKIPVNEWVHLAGTWDGSKAKIYINYQLVKEQSYTIAMSGSTDNLTLGRTGQSHTSESIIDEIRLTNKILIPSEFIQKP